MTQMQRIANRIVLSSLRSGVSTHKDAVDILAKTVKMKEHGKVKDIDPIVANSLATDVIEAGLKNGTVKRFGTRFAPA